MTNHSWSKDNPLFRVGIFPEWTTSGEGQVEVRGLYNPVVDAIALLTPRGDAIFHEATHRLFSIHVSGVNVLRGLAGISHCLSLYMLKVITEKNVKLSGNRLENYSVHRSGSGSDMVNSLLAKLRRIEALYDRCLSSLIPPIEIAAIDFAPLRIEDMLSFGYEHIKDTKENKTWKDKLIYLLAKMLAQDYGGFYNQIYDDIERTMLDTWAAYCSIKDTDFRWNLLQLASSINFMCYQDNLYEVHVCDSLSEIRAWAPHSEQPAAKEALEELIPKCIGKMWVNLAGLTDQYLDGIPPIYRVPFLTANAVNLMLVRSVPTVDMETWTDKSINVKLSPMLNPANATLLFWSDKEGQHVAVNPALEDMLDHIFERKSTLIGNELDRYWWERWSEMIALEVVRQSLKTGDSLVCPFLDCNEMFCPGRCLFTEFATLANERLNIPVCSATCSQNGTVRE